MDCISQCMADAEHCRERVGTRTQMRFLAQEFQCMSLLLERIFRRICRSVDFKRLCMNFGSLTLSSTWRLAPVVIGFKSSSENFSISKTIWIFLIVVPSFNATNCTCLFPRRVLTHPFTQTLEPISSGFQMSTIFVLFIVVYLSFGEFCYSNEPCFKKFTSS